ncbi:MAG: CrcB family protein [Mobilicoccus sp.]|nr:CrcB family protein [Mobilicoccus sp.]
MLVAGGGAIGATVRHVVGVSMGQPAPLVILGVNTLGCLLMGVLIASGASTRWRAFLGTGVLGGFTTVSTAALLSHDLLVRDPLAGLGYLVAMPALAVMATGLGCRGMRRLTTPTGGGGS